MRATTGSSRLFQRGLIPIGDAICRFNPIYGQGMTVAAQEACALRDLLEHRTGDNDPFEGLAPAYFAAIKPLVAAPWSMSTVSDFRNPLTRGAPPKNLENSLRFQAGLHRLAARDAEVHELMLSVRSFFPPPPPPKKKKKKKNFQIAFAMPKASLAQRGCALVE